MQRRALLAGAGDQLVEHGGAAARRGAGEVAGAHGVDHVTGEHVAQAGDAAAVRLLG